MMGKPSVCRYSVGCFDAQPSFFVGGGVTSPCMAYPAYLMGLTVPVGLRRLAA